MGYSRIFTPVLHFDDINGRPLVGGKLYTYQAGTSTPQAPYRNEAGTETNTNPIVLNERGECVAYLNDNRSYKFVLKDSLDNVIWEADKVRSPSSGGSGSVVTITPTVTTGTKIADYSIDGEAGELYAPNGGGGTEKRVGFVNTNGNVTHEISSDDLDQGFCNEDYVICHTEINTNPFAAIFLQCTDFWSKGSFSSIDVYAVYEWSGNTEYPVKLFEIDSTALSNNFFKDFSLIGQVSLPSNKDIKLRFKWNLDVGASIGDDLLIKCNCFVASTKLAQGLQ